MTRVFKYRAYSHLVHRDLPLLVSDKFYAPCIAELNDPGEALLPADHVIDLLAVQGKAFRDAWRDLREIRSAQGIFSLSRTCCDEVMWSHYAEGHHGYCVEYDLSRLVLEARAHWSTFPVRYSDAPPTLSIDDFLEPRPEGSQTARLLGYKSKRWGYEEETRVVVPRHGLNSYARASLKAIYFGVRFPEERVEAVQAALAGRGARFFRMSFEGKSYQLLARLLPSVDDEHTREEAVPAPVQDGAVPTRREFRGTDGQYDALRKAVEFVRRDPNCVEIVYADLSVNPHSRGSVFVQFRSSVPMDLDPVVRWSFAPEEQGKL